jgi:hypothetical protein
MIASIMLLSPTSALGTFIVLCILITMTTFVCAMSIIYITMPFLGVLAYGTNIAVGVWSIILLNRQDIVDGYNYVPEEERAKKRKRELD